MTTFPQRWAGFAAEREAYHRAVEAQKKDRERAAELVEIFRTNLSKTELAILINADLPPSRIEIFTEAAR